MLDKERLVATERLLSEARDILGDGGTFRLRILLEMAMLEIEKSINVNAGTVAPRKNDGKAS